jgi:hypothetical protein
LDSLRDSLKGSRLLVPSENRKVITSVLCGFVWPPESNETHCKPVKRLNLAPPSEFLILLINQLADEPLFAADECVFPYCFNGTDIHVHCAREVMNFEGFGVLDETPICVS